MATLQCVDPAVVVHCSFAVLAQGLATNIWSAEVAHNLSFTLEWFTSSNFEHLTVVTGMVTIFVPLGCFDNDWLLSVFQGVSPAFG